MRDEWTWRAYFDQELVMHQPFCPECRMRSFHLPWCSHSPVTDANRQAAAERRAMIERMERDARG